MATGQEHDVIKLAKRIAVIHYAGKEMLADGSATEDSILKVAGRMEAALDLLVEAVTRYENSRN